jgi:hypothetical protein
MTLSVRLAQRNDQLVALGPVPSWWRFRARAAWIRRYRAIMAMDLSATAEIYRAIYSTAAIEELQKSRVNYFALKVAAPSASPLYETEASK